MSFTLPDLKFAFDALEPHIDKETMTIHHDKHHAGYVKKLNAALENTDFADNPINDILKNIEQIPEDIRKAVINNGGGHSNHSLFWELLTNESTTPSDELLEAINKKFESLEKFKEQFANEAATRFGSGWAWLIINETGELEIRSTPNQDSPLMDNQTPILALDVWEHAYYLKYQNKRPDYIEAFWNVVNWNKVSELFKEIIN
jgi:Fe-Mn family superoxide dismutase